MGFKARIKPGQRIGQTSKVVLQARPRGAGPMGWPHRVAADGVVEWDWITLHDDGVSFTAGLDTTQVILLGIVGRVVASFIDSRDEIGDAFGYEFRVTALP